MASTARQQLAQAISEVEHLRIVAANDLAARERADNIVHQAEEALAAAKSREAASVARHADALLTSIRDDRPPPNSDVRDAKNAVSDAEAQLEACRSVMTPLDQAAVDSDATHQRALSKLPKLVDALIVEEAPVADLCAEIERLQENLNERRCALRFLQRFIPEGDARSMVNRVLNHNLLCGGIGMVEFVSWDHTPTMIAWRTAREALKYDADTALPE
jgi:hypothetical protein